MSTFEEEFPSLKDKGVDSFEEENTDNIVETEEFWYPQEEIEKFCLDKQKVKEVVEICLKNGWINERGRVNLLEELGL